MHRLARALAALCASALLAAAGAPLAVAAPPGIADPTALPFNVGGVTDIAFTPDNTLLLIASKGGELRVATVSAAGDPTLLPDAAIDLGPRLCTQSERGLLGVATDPSFATNRFVYLFYTWDRGVTGGGRCDQIGAGEPANDNTPVNRVSRFTLGADNTIDPASERVLVDMMLSPAGNHNGGDLGFGNDGLLYIAVGDGGCDYNGGGCGGTNDATRDRNILLGKILRIIPNPNLTPEQRIPPTNPFAASGTVCATEGRGPQGTPIDTHCRETFAWGLRNPFRIAFDPNTAAPATRFFVNDVGQSVREEIDLGQAGADYGWNCREGTRVNSTSGACNPQPAGMVDPIHEYNQNNAADDPDTVGCNAITGGAFVPAGVWPAALEGAYLFTDHGCGQVFQIDADSPDPDDRALFHDLPGGSVELAFGPSPQGAALYVASINSGSISRFVPSAAGNSLPIAALSADPPQGSRTVVFDGSGSSDPDGDDLTYLWNFGNGDTLTTSAPTTTYTYPADGRYIATLQVRDSSGAPSLYSASVQIDAFTAPPVDVEFLPLVVAP